MFLVRKIAATCVYIAAWIIFLPLLLTEFGMSTSWANGVTMLSITLAAGAYLVIGSVKFSNASEFGERVAAHKVLVRAVPLFAAMWIFLMGMSEPSGFSWFMTVYPFAIAIFAMAVGKDYLGRWSLRDASAALPFLALTLQDWMVDNGWSAGQVFGLVLVSWVVSLYVTRFRREKHLPMAEIIEVSETATRRVLRPTKTLAGRGGDEFAIPPVPGTKLDLRA